ncbi:MAG: hypothetical protein B7Z05_01445 [Thiotrichales bacterium 32-46-8]|nr:hypothetical protein [Gammaproteobacteria bacterium]OYX07490.1 MAG: hypothetical protein B7Z05_01445 [Thiotrichales bacterium 32-46-8]OZA98338.1 MAG: hypothetical protein B7X52_00465 [Thiotrichales bacterium 34-46-19]OZB87301.1 MAG: hypothetical protein B7Z48_01015 [Thiotrichales bacterium 12-47-6]UCG18574.1 MAG: hypothetical protein JSU84_08580 [Thiotrichales bacterium]
MLKPLFSLVLLLPNLAWTATASDFSLLGLKVSELSQTEIRQALYKWDGVMKPQASLHSKQMDRFYPVNILRETYRVDFRYELDGSFSSLQIRYRPYHSEYKNSSLPLSIKDVRTQLEPTIGSPTSRVRRTESVLQSYESYRWEDEQVSITLDFEDQQPGRPIVLQLRKKNTTLASNYRS